ncbi:GAD-like domain-containing protein [Cellvibrio sp. PSBB023]|uniref:GAD-like domain-containing protein n=1 Tax=Cellvibrio sp. PSBB023 TaxID=1945512 RepID=UPI00098FBC89|nr:GAD-like domain-containing protein [Cellvibrio sp. PSBB023]AQT61705.1 glutamyl-tRNA amidotransferase [Cellvibrio sp. PSBB023]
MDEYFNEFLNEEGFSPITSSIPVNEETLKHFHEKIPNKLKNYWVEYGFSGFAEGLFWIVNPQDYQNIVDKWLQKTPMWGRENFYAIARSAFGELYIRGSQSDSTTIIDPHLNNIIPGEAAKKTLSAEEIDKAVGVFFMFKSKKRVDYYDKNNKPLFQRCLKKYGMLEHDEMYTFSPALALGGIADINNIKKVKILEQLSILCDLDTPVVLPSAGELFGSN